ncbi:MAG: Asp23/Gls24 family envelope stress response protein [Clostridia bacterium]|nr:Asp23/Gls24 family envelope stress response protein [Clostridia bacterium]
MISYENVMGKVNVSEDYLSKLIGSEVTSCYGVVGMVPGNSRQKINKILSKDDAVDTGITVKGTADSISVEVHIEVIYGMNIKALAASITEKVKYIVKEVTEIDVDRVVVKVDGIKE